MLRAGFIFLLLFNYLLVVGAGLVNRPEMPRYSAAHPYVHSLECQQRNYLRLDCFDTCNGDQSAVQARPDHEMPKHLLGTLKSLDLHCLQETPWVPLHCLGQRPAGWQSVVSPPEPVGYAAGPYLPPRIG